jgi:hypothetical protein
VLVVATALTGAFLTATPTVAAADEPLDVEQLVCEGAAVEVEIDVNGEAAVQLIGGVLDEAAVTFKQQAAAGQALPPQAAMAEPIIEPAKELVKSLSRVVVLVMKTDESAAELDVIDYYGAKMAPRGWTRLATIRTGSGENILAMVAPGGKGIFAAIRPNEDELVVALLTTRQPIGDLLAQLVRASGSEVVPKFLAARASQPAPDTQCEKQEESEAEDAQTAESAEAPAGE